ncbi:MAG TPA: hypothetical protein VL092_12230, partial [Chitinophagaceae bacterium]|nr:hypothetical protein [Chitinophagaceae bacterium]
MENSRLQDDLLLEFRQEKELINSQLALLDPLAVSLRKPVAARIWSSIVLLVLEGLSWLGIVSVVAFCIVRDNIYPFYILARLRVKGATLGFNERDLNYLYWSVLVFAGIIAVLLFVIARNLARLRKKNAILQMAASRIKTVVGDQLKRKAAIDTIDQRHFGIL